MTDLRFGLRMLARNPGSTALIVMLLALGIGASTAIFSLFDAVLLRSLPVRDPDQLVRLVQQLPKLGARSAFRYVYYQALHDHANSLAAVFGETIEDTHFRMTAPGPAEQITLRAVTSEFFAALGVKPLYGRVLQADDANRRFDTPPAVLSYGFWRRRFGGDPRAVQGQSLSIDGHRFLIMGVMPRAFNGLSIDRAPDLRIPLSAMRVLISVKPELLNFELAGRLRAGFTSARAEAECLAIWQATMKEYYRSVRHNPPRVVASLLRRGMQLVSLQRGVSTLRDRYGDVLRLLMAAIVLLVLIVCLNVAGVLLARAAARQREIAVRLAIGATRLRIMRQMATESLLLALLGAAGGLLLAVAAIPLAVRLLPPVRDLDTTVVPIALDVHLNLRVFLFLLACSLLTALIFAVSPAVAASRSSLDSVLRTVRATGGTRGRQWLIVSQIALCTVLLVGASLFVRTFQQLRDTNPGFERDSVATFTADLGSSKKAPSSWPALHERVSQLPGVVSVAISWTAVMRDHGVSATVLPAGETISRADFMNANVNEVSPEYFQTMGMRILAGRDFIAADALPPDSTVPKRTIVNEAFARRFFPNTDAIGKLIGTGEEGSFAKGTNQIIGVVSDAKYRSLREPVRPMFYTLDTDFDSFVLNVRTRGRPETIIPEVQRVAHSIAPQFPFLEVHTLAEEVAANAAPERMTAVLASLFGGIAMLLAGAGTYGLLAYLVVQRRREIGIRMALGAHPVHVAALLGRQTFVLLLGGLVAGLGTALLAGSAIHPLLYGVSPRDPLSLFSATVFIAVIVIAATAVPMLDALQVEPAEALRLEN